MIYVENPVAQVRENANEIAQQVLKTDLTNITMSQWQVEMHQEQGSDTVYVAYCAINRRLDPMEKPYLLHMVASDYEHLKLMFQHVEFAPGQVH